MEKILTCYTSSSATRYQLLHDIDLSDFRCLASQAFIFDQTDGLT